MHVRALTGACDAATWARSTETSLRTESAEMEFDTTRLRIASGLQPAPASSLHGPQSLWLPGCSSIK